MTTTTCSKMLLSNSVFPSILLPPNNYSFDKTALDRGHGPPVVGWEDTSGPTEKRPDGNGSTLASDDEWLTADAEVTRGHGKKRKWQGFNSGFLQYNSDSWRVSDGRFSSKPHTEILLKRSIRRKNSELFHLCFSFSISWSERTIDLCQKLRRKMPALPANNKQKQYPRRRKRRPFNLTCMKIFCFHRNLSSVEDSECTYTQSVPHLTSHDSILFSSAEKGVISGEEGRTSMSSEFSSSLIFISFHLSSLRREWSIKESNHWGTYYFLPPWIHYIITPDPHNFTASWIYDSIQP